VGGCGGFGQVRGGAPEGARAGRPGVGEVGEVSLLGSMNELPVALSLLLLRLF